MLYHEVLKAVIKN